MDRLLATGGAVLVAQPSPLQSVRFEIHRRERGRFGGMSLLLASKLAQEPGQSGRAGVSNTLLLAPGEASL